MRPLVHLTAFLLLLQLLTVAVRADEEGPPYGPARELCQLENRQIDESSGMAFGGHANPGVLWTHNDSGDAPRIYAFDLEGKHRGSYTLRGAGALDWEDMASFTLDGTGYLLAADTGDNRRERKTLSIYLLEEPKLPEQTGDHTLEVKRTIEFRFPDGPHDCEGLGVDVAGRKIYLVTKHRGEGTFVYTLPLNTSAEAEGVLNAERVGELSLPMVTALDISRDGRRAVTLTYTHAYEYTRQGDESWATAFAREPRLIELPDLKQQEAICYSPDGRSLFVTSESLPTPLLQLSARPAQSD